MKKAIVAKLVHDESRTEIFGNLQQLNYETKFNLNAYLRSNTNIYKYKKYPKLSAVTERY